RPTSFDDRTGAPAGEVGLVEGAEHAGEQLVELLALPHLQVAHRERHEVEGACPLGRLEMRRQSKYRLLVEPVESRRGGAHETGVADERGEGLLGARAEPEA